MSPCNICSLRCSVRCTGRRCSMERWLVSTWDRRRVSIAVGLGGGRRMPCCTLRSAAGELVSKYSRTQNYMHTYWGCAISNGIPVNRCFFLTKHSAVPTFVFYKALWAIQALRNTFFWKLDTPHPLVTLIKLEHANSPPIALRNTWMAPYIASRYLACHLTLTFSKKNW